MSNHPESTHNCDKPSQSHHMLHDRTAKPPLLPPLKTDFAQIFAYLPFVKGFRGILWLVQESLCVIKFLHLGMR